MFDASSFLRRVIILVGVCLVVVGAAQFVDDPIDSLAAVLSTSAVAVKIVGQRHLQRTPNEG